MKRRNGASYQEKLLKQLNVEWRRCHRAKAAVLMRGVVVAEEDPNHGKKMGAKESARQNH